MRTIVHSNFQEELADKDLLLFQFMYAADYIHKCPGCGLRAMGLDCLSVHLKNPLGHRGNPEMVDKYISRLRIGWNR